SADHGACDRTIVPATLRCRFDKTHGMNTSSGAERLCMSWCLCRSALEEIRLESFFIPTLIVALAEIGDKTQLLALLLAARYRRPWLIICGIVVATLANHTAAGAVGNWVSSLFTPAVLSWSLAACFAAVALWTLVPDKLDDDDTKL